MNSIQKNLARIRTQIKSTAEKAGRDPTVIKLVAVSKRVPWQRVEEAVGCGQAIFGENYIQEAQAKISYLKETLSWHFIGHLQSNKVKQAAQIFDVIETIDRLELAVLLNNHMEKSNRTISIFIQVNIGQEPQKSGIHPEHAEELLRKTNNLKNLKVMGLMAIPPFFDNPEMVRPYYKQMREMLDDFETKGLLGRHGQPELSMGMSNDFEVAIEEGATLIRLGTAVFGPRHES